VNAHLLLLLAYSVGLTALGLWIARRVRGPADFFVAGRALSWPLLASNILAANIGAGTTIGATGLAYRDGLSAWWWNGAAGLGTLVLGLWLGPKLWTLASARGYLTAGDFLEDRYGPRVRSVVTLLIWVGTLAILAGQLIAGSLVLEVVAGLPRWASVLIGGAAMTIYFAAGGLLSAVWVNLVQLIVLLAGFALALPAVLAKAGGVAAIAAIEHPGYLDPLYSAGAMSGWTMLILLGPGFIVSPGLIQKAYSASSARAVMWGLAAAGVAQLIFSFGPVLLGMAAHLLHPDLARRELALPTVLMSDLPTWLGTLGLAAVFSAEVSTCDAILFMLSTSLSQDLYKRSFNPDASPAMVLRVARLAALAGGALGMVLAMFLATVVDALAVFYSLLGAALLVPVVGAFLFPRAGARAAMAAIVCGVTTLLVVRFGTDRTGWADPSLWGLIGSATAFLLVAARSKATTERTENTK
jgi:SSS family solute:Na+ symporter